MAERPSVKDMLAAARQGGAAKPASAPEPAAEVEAAQVEAVEIEATSESEAPAASKPSLGRPMTLKEKLEAARTGGAPAPAAAPKPAAAKKAVLVAAEAAPAEPKPAAAPLGRPMTMAEKLASARGGSAPASSGAKLAAPAAKAAAPAAKASARELPPLDKITDPRDLAEALRRVGADTDKAVKADAAAKAATAAGATPGAAAAAAKASAAKKLESKAIPPKPSKGAATAPAAGSSQGIARRPFLYGFGVIIVGWGAFLVGMFAHLSAYARFMFPNVLAEPPSTIKVGLPTNFEPEQVNDRWKAEWGFWIVRSANYDGEDKIYAIQSVCTHLGCPPNWLVAEAKFKCPCHGSGFYVSGVNFEGPAPRPLERFKVSLNDAGEMIVDKSQKFQEELKQWSDPDSFIIA